jgi:predicted aldo/keto reductase-like oxidoreductase
MKMNMLETVSFGRTGLTVTRVAFGGIPVMRLSRKEGARLVREVLDLGVNFIDTANMYGDSEEKIGDGLAGSLREDLVIASKSMARDRDTFMKHLETSLSRLKTEYLDVYQLHGISSEEDMKRVMSPGGALEGLLQAIDDGRVRHPGFSSHNLDVAGRMMRTGKFSVVQVPFNFVDREAEEEIIPLSREMNMGFICMKPLGGGLLHDANLCFRYLMQFDGIVPDPGIERIEEMREIIEILKTPRPLLETERVRMEEIRTSLGDTWCHRCDYCQPCPEGIPISLVLVTESVVRRMSYDTAVPFLRPAIDKAASCTECGSCAERCPYDLKIPDLLKRYRTGYDNYVRTRRWT